MNRQEFFGKNQFNLAKGLKATQVHDSDTQQPFSQRLVGEWAVYYNIKKSTWISWIHPMRVLAAYVSSEQISSNTNGIREKKQYNNTKFIVLDGGVASS